MTNPTIAYKIVFLAAVILLLSPLDVTYLNPPMIIITTATMPTPKLNICITSLIVLLTPDVPGVSDPHCPPTNPTPSQTAFLLVLTPATATAGVMSAPSSRNEAVNSLIFFIICTSFPSSFFNNSSLYANGAVWFKTEHRSGGVL